MQNSPCVSRWLVRWILSLTLTTLATLAPGWAAERPLELWFYYSTNLQVADNLKPLEEVFRRAAAAGYCKVLLADSKFSRLGTVPTRYFENVEKVKKLAEELQLEIVPAIFPVGYSGDLLSQDPELVESMPVREALYVVDGQGAARPVTAETVRLPETFSYPEDWTFHDPTVHFENGEAHVKDAPGRNARVFKRFAVEPFRHYHVSAWVKTQDYTAKPVWIQVITGSGGMLNWQESPVKTTQDWTRLDATFNSLDNREVQVLFRAGWEGEKGEMWWKEPRIEDAGLMNIVRRKSTPLEVKIDGGRTLQEKVDFDEVRDPRMGRVPWPGGYEVWHEPPVLKTKLPEGTRLRVSFCHAASTGAGQVMICPSEPGTLELLRDQARRLEELFHPRSYFMSHDEIRILGWDPACEARGLPAGKILAENVSACVKILEAVNPQAKIYVWSDMFDPNHNARKDYYLVKGDLAESWKGLAPQVVVANWNFDEREKSLAWFAKEGHRQIIAGYYDHAPEEVLEWLKSARGISGVEGIMYTTWEDKYDDLEKFAELVRNNSSQ